MRRQDGSRPKLSKKITGLGNRQGNSNDSDNISPNRQLKQTDGLFSKDPRGGWDGWRTGWNQIKSIAARFRRFDSSVDLDRERQFDVERLEERQMLSSVSLYESEATTIQTTLVDATAASEYEVQVDLGDGSDAFLHTDFTVSQNGPTNSVSVDNIPIVFADDGDYDISIRLLVAGNVVDEATFDADVTNVAPEITVGGTGASHSTGAPVYVQFGASDPGDDQITEWSVDWGDGNVEIVAGDSEWAAHSYIHDGIYSINVSATDEDGTYDPVAITVDSTFGDSGAAELGLAEEQVFAASTQQADGSLLVVTTPADTAVDAAAKKFTLSRMASDGFADLSFGVAGTAEFALPEPDGVVVDFVKVTSVTTQPDDQILVGGEISIGGDAAFAVVRFNADGSLDELFGDADGELGAGIVILQISDNADGITDLAFAGQNIYVVGGTSDPVTETDLIAVAKFNLDGSIVETFGTDGVTTIAFSTFAGNQDATATLINVFETGNILITGESTSGSSRELALVKLTVNGQLDSFFGGGAGLTGVELIGNSSGLHAKSATILSGADERFVLAAEEILADGTAQTSLHQFNGNGSADTTFGSGGSVAVAAAGLAIGSVGAVSQQENGQFLVAGEQVDTQTFGVSGKSFVQRVNSDGSLDSSFGDAGTMSIASSGTIQNVFANQAGDIVVLSDKAADPSDTQATDSVVLRQVSGTNTVTVQTRLDGSTMFDLPAVVSQNIGELLAGGTAFGSTVWRPDVDGGSDEWRPVDYDGSSDFSNYQIDGDIQRFALTKNETAVMVSAGASGIGYVLYSQEHLGTRFGLADRAENHLLAVRHSNGWQYNDGTQWVAFTPISGSGPTADRLIAEVDFSDGTVTNFDNQSTAINGVNAGFLASNIQLTPNTTSGSPISYLVDGDSVWTGDPATLGNASADGSPDTTTTIEFKPQGNGRTLIYFRTTTTDREVGQADAETGLALQEKVTTTVTSTIVESSDQATIDEVELTGALNPVDFTNYFTVTINHEFTFIEMRSNHKVGISKYNFDADYNWDGSDSVSYDLPSGSVSNSIVYDTNGSIDYGGVYRIQAFTNTNTGEQTYLADGIGSNRVRLFADNETTSSFDNAEFDLDDQFNTNFQLDSYDVFKSIGGGSIPEMEGDTPPLVVAPPTDLPDWMNTGVVDTDLNSLLTGGPGSVPSTPSGTVDGSSGGINGGGTTGGDPGASIEGNVWHDYDENGINDEVAGSPLDDGIFPDVPNVKVALWADNDGDQIADQLVRITETDLDGRYQFDGLNETIQYQVEVAPALGSRYTNSNFDSDVSGLTGRTEFVTALTGTPTILDAGLIFDGGNYDIATGFDFGSGGVTLDGVDGSVNDTNGDGTSGGSGDGEWHSYARQDLGWSNYSLTTDGVSSTLFSRVDPFSGDHTTSSSTITTANSSSGNGWSTSLMGANTNSSGGVNSTTFGSSFDFDQNTGSFDYEGETFSEFGKRTGEYRSVKSESSSDSTYISDNRNFGHTFLNTETTSDEEADAYIDGRIFNDSDRQVYNADSNSDSSLELRYARATEIPEILESGDSSGDSGSGDGTGDGDTGDGSGSSNGGDSSGGTGDGSTGGTGDGSSSTGGDSGSTGGDSGSTGDSGSGDSGDTGETDPPIAAPLVYVENLTAIQFLKDLEVTNQAKLASIAGADGTVELTTDEVTEAAARPTGYDGQNVIYNVIRFENASQYHEEDNSNASSRGGIEFVGESGDTKFTIDSDSNIGSTVSNQSGVITRNFATSGNYEGNDGIVSDQYSSTYYTGTGGGNHSFDADFALVVPDQPEPESSTSDGGTGSSYDNGGGGSGDNGGSGDSGGTGDTEPTSSVTDPYVDGNSSSSSDFTLDDGKTTSVSRNTIRGRKHEGALTDANYDILDWFQTNTLLEVDNVDQQTSSGSRGGDSVQGKSDSDQDGTSAYDTSTTGSGRVESEIHHRTKTTVITPPNSGATGGGAALEEDGFVINANLVSQVDTTDSLYKTTSPITTNGQLTSSSLTDMSDSLIDPHLFDPDAGTENGGQGGEGSGDNSGDPTDEIYEFDGGDFISKNSGSSTLNSNSSYGINVNSPSFELEYSSSSNSTFDNGGFLNKGLGYKIKSDNKAPSSNTTVTDNRVSSLEYKADDGLYVTTDGELKVTTVSSGEFENIEPILSTFSANDGETRTDGTSIAKTLEKISFISAGNYKKTYDNITTQTLNYEDFGQVIQYQWMDPEESGDSNDSDSDSSLPPVVGIGSVGTGKLTRTTNAVGDESFYRMVNSTENETDARTVVDTVDPRTHGGRTDWIETDFKKPDNHWNLTDIVILEYSDAPSDPDALGAIPRGTATLSHELSGSRHSLGTVETGGMHDYTTVTDTPSYSTTTNQFSGLGGADGYTSLTSFLSDASRSGIITATYSPEGDLLSATGSHTAQILSSGNASASALDHKEETTVEPNNYNRTTELLSAQTTTQSDHFTAQIDAIRTAATEELEDGSLVYRPTEVGTIANTVSGQRDVSNPQTLTTTIDGSTPTIETANPTSNESYGVGTGNEIVTDEVGFREENYGTFGYRGVANDSNFGGIGSFANSGESNGSSNDGSTGDGTSNYSSGGGGIQDSDGDQDSDNNPSADQGWLARAALTLANPGGASGFLLSGSGGGQVVEDDPSRLIDPENPPNAPNWNVDEVFIQGYDAKTGTFGVWANDDWTGPFWYNTVHFVGYLDLKTGWVKLHANDRWTTLTQIKNHSDSYSTDWTTFGDHTNSFPTEVDPHSRQAVVKHLKDAGAWGNANNQVNPLFGSTLARLAHIGEWNGIAMRQDKSESKWLGKDWRDGDFVDALPADEFDKMSEGATNVADLGDVRK